MSAAPARCVLVHAAPACSSFFTLAHPRTGAPMLCARSGDRLLQVQCMSSADPASWLITGAEDRVEQDGRLFVCTPIDPVFLLLPQLAAARGPTSAEKQGLYKPLDEIPPSL